MCGRYYVDDETAREIEKLVRQTDERLQAQQVFKDVYPSQTSLVLRSMENYLQAENLIWGFPNFNRKGVVINARSETVLEKQMFRDSVLHRRCVVPAKGFYEWDQTKNKISFQNGDGSVLFMAGIYKQHEDKERFVILTTRANKSVKDVHNRMPLILEREEIELWMNDNNHPEHILRKEPTQLIKYGYQQQSFL